MRWTLLLAYVLLFSFHANANIHVQAVAESRAHFDDDAGNNADADDPAIWVHPYHSQKSMVIATLKEGGLDVYDLKGALLQHIPAPPAPTETDRPGRFNNVDLIYDFPLGNRRIDLAVVTDRGFDKLRIFQVNRRNQDAILEEVTANNTPLIFSKDQSEVNQKATAYGLATVKPFHNGSAFAFVSRNDRTDIAKLVLYSQGDNKVNYAIAERFNVNSEFVLPDGSTWEACREEDSDEPHVEGMVVDKQRGILYMAQEAIGVLKTSIWQADNINLVDTVREFGVPYSRTWDEAEEEYICEYDYNNDPGFGGQYLSADVEGLALYDAGFGKGYLLTSSQSDNKFVLYDRGEGNAYMGEFNITDGTVDGVEHTDGIALSNARLGWKYREGLLVAHDGNNTQVVNDDQEEARDNTNFKWVRWQDIAEPLGLQIDNYNRSRGN